MDAIKVDDTSSSDTSCFICLQSVIPVNQERSDSLKFFLSYLKIGENAKVCEKCGEQLIKFRKLFNVMEKASLEMDILMGIIQSSISSSTKDLKQAPFASVRECVVKKCKARMVSPKPTISLQRVDLSKLTKKESTSASDCPDDSSPSQEEDGLNNSIPIASVVMDVKIDVLEDSTKRKVSNLKTRVRKPHKCDMCDKSFATSYYLGLHKSKSKSHQPKPTLEMETFCCKICPKIFVTLQSLKMHKRDVHTEKRAKSAEKESPKTKEGMCPPKQDGERDRDRERDLVGRSSPERSSKSPPKRDRSPKSSLPAERGGRSRSRSPRRLAAPQSGIYQILPHSQPQWGGYGYPPAGQVPPPIWPSYGSPQYSYNQWGNQPPSFPSVRWQMNYAPAPRMYFSSSSENQVYIRLPGRLHYI